MGTIGEHDIKLASIAENKRGRSMKTLLVQPGSHGPILRQAMTDSGWEVASCEDAEEGRQRQSHDRFRVVVIDLPDSGEAEQFGRWLRRQPLGNRTFILLAIPAEDREDVARLLESCADEVISRPYDASSLKIRLPSIRRQVQLHQEWREKEDGLNSRAQQQVAIAALGQAALTQDLPTLFDLAGKLIVYTIEVDYFCVLERTDDGQGLKFLAGFGWRDGRLGMTLSNPLPGTLTARTLVGEDCFSENLDDQRQFEKLDFMAEDGAVSGVSVAIKAKERGVFGVLGAYANSRRVFKEDELRFLEGLANVLGAAMERQRIDAEIQLQQSQVQHLQRLESVGQLAAGNSNVKSLSARSQTLSTRKARSSSNGGASVMATGAMRRNRSS